MTQPMTNYQQDLWPVFMSECEKNLTEIREAIGLVQSGTGRSDTCERLHRAAHTVKGNAAMMGFHEIEQAARTLELCAAKLGGPEAARRLDGKELEKAYGVLEGIVTRVTV